MHSNCEGGPENTICSESSGEQPQLGSTNPSLNMTDSSPLPSLQSSPFLFTRPCVSIPRKVNDKTFETYVSDSYNIVDADLAL